MSVICKFCKLPLVQCKDLTRFKKHFHNQSSRYLVRKDHTNDLKKLYYEFIGCCSEKYRHQTQYLIPYVVDISFYDFIQQLPLCVYKNNPKLQQLKNYILFNYSVPNINDLTALIEKEYVRIIITTENDIYDTDDFL